MAVAAAPLPAAAARSYNSRAAKMSWNCNCWSPWLTSNATTAAGRVVEDFQLSVGVDCAAEAAGGGRGIGGIDVAAATGAWVAVALRPSASFGALRVEGISG